MKRGFIKKSSSRSVSVRDISYYAIPRTKTLRANGERARAFTLIELLVVVLIIGILAAIALPQYQKAVTKARYTQLMILVKAAVQAQDVYYLANNEYADSFEKLDIDIPPYSVDDTLTNFLRITISDKAIMDLHPIRVVGILPGLVGPRYFCDYPHAVDAPYPGKCICYGYTKQDTEICKSFGGVLQGEYDEQHLDNNMYVL